MGVADEKTPLSYFTCEQASLHCFQASKELLNHGIPVGPIMFGMDEGEIEFSADNRQMS